MPDVIANAIAFVFYSCAIYILTRAIGVPYELKTDRLWKYGEETKLPDDPEREEIPETSHEVIDLQSLQRG